MALRGRLAWRIGDHDLAIEILARAAEEAQQDAIAADASLSLACLQLGLGDTAAAATTLKAADQRRV